MQMLFGRRDGRRHFVGMRERSVGRRQDEADSAWHAVISTHARLLFSALVLRFGRSFTSPCGGGSLNRRLPLIEHRVLRPPHALVWLMNGLASVNRATGNWPFHRSRLVWASFC